MFDIKSKAEATASTVEEQAIKGEIQDIGAGLYAEAEQLSAEELEQEDARVRKILDRRIMPIVCRDSISLID